MYFHKQFPQSEAISHCGHLAFDLELCRVDFRVDFHSFQVPTPSSTLSLHAGWLPGPHREAPPALLWCSGHLLSLLFSASATCAMEAKHVGAVSMLVCSKPATLSVLLCSLVLLFTLDKSGFLLVLVGRENPVVHY